MLFTLLAILYTALLSGLLGISAIAFFSRWAGEQPQSNGLHPVYLFVVGLAVASLVGGILSVFLNIGLVVHLALWLVGLAALWFQRERVRQWLRAALFWGKGKINPIALMVILLFTVIMVMKSGSMAENYDTGLYHAQFIQWMEKYPVIPGLGNLHSRFAFDSSWLLLSAIFGLKFLGAVRVYPLNIFLITLSFWLFAVKGSGLFSQVRLSNLFGLLLLPFTILYVPVQAASPVADIPAYLLLWMVVLLFLEKYEDGTLQVWNLHSWVILSLSLFAVTIKLSVGPIVLIPAALWILTLDKSRRASADRVSKPPTGAILVVSAALLIPWLARNVILSGYLLYPVPQLGLPWLDWTIPRDWVQSDADWIRSWAIMPGTDKAIVLALPIDQWLPQWVETRLIYAIMLAVGLAAAIFLLVRDGLTALIRKSGYALFAIDGFILVLTLYWFFSAPDVRFGYGIIVAGLVYGLARILLKVAAHRIAPLAWLCLNLILVCLGLIYAILTPGALAHLVSPDPLPAAETRLVQLPSGMMVKMPLASDQCWDVDLPCSPAALQDLRMRGNAISDGFTSMIKPSP